MITIRHLKTFFGPSPIAGSPVVLAGISLPGERSDTAAQLLQGCRRLHESFPDWLGESFLIRKPFAETVALTVVHWALAALNERDGFLHDAGASASSGGALVWIGFHHPPVSLAALELALHTLEMAGRSASFVRADADKGLSSLWQLCKSYHPDYQARILMQGARVRDIPFMPFLSGRRYWQFDWGNRARIFLETMSNADGTPGYRIQISKVLSKGVFAACGFPTPEYRLVNRTEELGEAAGKVGWPCVVKPLSEGRGRGVSAGMTTMRELEAAFAHARNNSRGAVMIERFVPGTDYRLMVVNGSFLAAVRRTPPSVTGDGQKTVRRLIGILNAGRSLNLRKSRYLSPVEVDSVVESYLEHQGVSLETVPEEGRRVTLLSTANRASGGGCADETGRVHPDVRRMAVAVAKSMGLATAGIDYITTDIGKSWREGGALIEVNTTPGMGALVAAGLDPVEVAGAVLGELPGRIPFQLVLVHRSFLDQAAAILMGCDAEEGFGRVCGKQATIGRTPLSSADPGPWENMRVLLRHQELREVCLVCAPEEIMLHGMPVDKVDRIVLCDGVQFPDAWMKVLREHSGSMLGVQEGKRFLASLPTGSGSSFGRDSGLEP